ncbi:alpha/beta fold hydrolase [Leucobacter sp. GX0328]
MKDSPRPAIFWVAMPPILTYGENTYQWLGLKMRTIDDAAKLLGRWDSPQGRARYMDAYARAFASLPQPAETLDIRTDFGSVRCYRFAGAGSGPHPLLLLPGKSSGTPIWADNMPSLLELGDVYAVDLLGEPGMSVQDRPITDAADQATWLAQTMQALPEEAFHLAGISFGGWSAANLVLHDAGKVATLTLIDAALTLANLPVRMIMHSLPATVRWFPKSWRDGFNSYMAGGAPVADLPVAEMIEAGMKHFILRLPQLKLIPEAELRRITVPTLVIIGGDSAIHDARQAAATARRSFPNAIVHVYEGASHAVNGEQPERIANDIAALIGANR